MPRIDLQVGEQKKHVERALKELRDGFVIVAPLERGYVYLADAFTPFAVRAMHVLRGDQVGVAAQVLTHNAEMVGGLAREVPAEAKALMKEFWPGELSLNLKPILALNWDLGDDKALDLFSVRVPKAKFIKALLKVSGPLVVESASPAGAEPMLKINRAAIKEWQVAAVFDGGPLKSGKRTSVVEVSEGGLRLVREGAISAARLAAIAPSLSTT